MDLAFDALFLQPTFSKYVPIEMISMFQGYIRIQKTRKTPLIIDWVT